jgi:hypothetical protein
MSAVFFEASLILTWHTARLLALAGYNTCKYDASFLACDP